MADPSLNLFLNSYHFSSNLYRAFGNAADKRREFGALKRKADVFSGGQQDSFNCLLPANGLLSAEWKIHAAMHPIRAVSLHECRWYRLLAATGLNPVPLFLKS